MNGRPAPRPERPALERCVGDPEAFIAGVLDRAPQRWSTDEGFEDLLSLAEFDAQLSGAGLRHPAVRLARDGEILPRASFTKRVRTGSVWVDDMVDPARTLAAFADGATIVLQSLQRWWSPISRFCRELEDALERPVQANAYLTPAGAAGFSPHHDTHDVFVLQVHGTKHWTVRAPLVDAPLDRHRSESDAATHQPVLFEADLEPGDCLYLPRGHIHSAAAQEGASLHLTIGILSVTHHDVLRRLVDRAADEPAFRRSLPVGHAADRESAARVVKEVVDELVSWLEELDPAELGAAIVDREALRRRPLLDGHLLDLAQLDHIDDTTTLVRPPDVRWRIADGARGADDEPGRITLHLADRRLDLPATLVPALERLLDGTPRPVSELADLMDGASRLVLARRLVREGLLRRHHGP